MGQLRQGRLVRQERLFQSEVSENGLACPRVFGEKNPGWLKSISLLLLFQEQPSSVVDRSLFHLTFQGLASMKGSSRMLEKTLSTLPCLHSTVKKKEEGPERKDSGVRGRARKSASTPPSWNL